MKSKKDGKAEDFSEYLRMENYEEWQRVGWRVSKASSPKFYTYDYKKDIEIVFMTSGLLLEILTHDTTFLDDYSHVILDEVHER